MSILDDIYSIASRHSGKEMPGLPRLAIFSWSRPTQFAPAVYEPVVCLILKGRKRILIGEKSLEYGRGDHVVVSAEVAVMGQIVEASSEAPFLSLNLNIDPLAIFAAIADTTGSPNSLSTPAISVGRPSASLLDAWRRLLELFDYPEEIAVMAPRIEQEILLRLLMGPHGEILRQFAHSDSRLNRLRRSMKWIRDNHSRRLSVAQMAHVAQMSQSVFYRRFKMVTGLSPLQYQKYVRLHEARRQIAGHGATAASVGFAVGYESASQFSREYKRLFGEPPLRNAETIKSNFSA